MNAIVFLIKMLVECKYNTIQYNTIQYNTMSIQYNLQCQYNTIQYNTIQYNTIQCIGLAIVNDVVLKQSRILYTLFCGKKSVAICTLFM